MKNVLSILLMMIGCGVIAQQYDPIHPPNTFRNADNPLYWGNKKPAAEYWQQDVAYKIHATIDEENDVINGVEQLTYWNNSPDTLRVVYFHLYQNAFQPGSYNDNLYHANGVTPEYSGHEAEGLGTEITSIKLNGTPVKTTLDNTILIVHLNEPIYPQTSVVFDINFDTYYGDGSVRRRMKYFMSYGQKQFNGCHWYPRIACYDRKFGWTTDQHLGKEFYGDFGTFDVTLNFANDYIVGATGNLLNRDEVLPPDLYAQLKIENFKDKPYGSAPSVIVERIPGARKEWHYYAENVHDFAFTASPHYRIGEFDYLPEGENGRVIKAYSFAAEPHASGWQYAAAYTAKVLKVYSEDIGMYGYHKMIVADARDGMEYPMITLDNGTDPNHRGLLAHEIGHNWFYGMMNNNETYRAFMDEGFTQFLTAWSQIKIDGVNRATNPPKNKYIDKHRWDRPVLDDEIYYGYMRDAILGQDAPLNTHSHDFESALGHGGGYGHVYYKTAAMLYNLQYVLGEELFLKAMQNYFDEWSFCHPYPEDFRNSFIRYTKVDLNWYFDQWLETPKQIDYKIKSVKRSEEDENTFDITFKRKGSMQMPLDFRVKDSEGRTFDYHIPNQYFVKKTDAEILPKWTGYGKLKNTYTATVELPEAYPGKKVKVDEVVIDPTEILADANILNNRTKGNVAWHFDAHVWNFPDWRKYHIYYRPDIWWNAYDGLKLGWHMHGNYMYRKHIFWFTGWYNSRLFQGNLPNEAIVSDKNKYYTNDRFSYNFSYRTAMDKIVKHTDFTFKSRFLDGLVMNQVGFVKEFPRNVDLWMNIKSMIRPEANDANYLIYPDEWTTNKWNNTLNAGMDYDFKHKVGDATAKVSLNARASITQDYNYQFVEASYVGDRKFGRIDLDTRVFGRIGFGDNTPAESALYFAGANPEEMMENKYVRASGFYPNDWIGAYGANTNHFHFGGGLNMRGYAGYYLVEVDEAGNTVQAYNGKSGFATNIELGFDRLVKWKKLPKLKRKFDLDTYLFADAGVIQFENTLGDNEFSNIRFDAGVGAAFTVKQFWKFYNIKPLTIRFDVPFYVSHAPATEDNVQFRWVLSVSRAF